ncbi:helix-turn-helix domain-containing protein [Haloarculaceae archaeon H-GB11]|nr:helix-turn-helix domain-containing protein [Haloarculaceae archaeon H-GB1-1]MEA5387823.1 helix-turn-helix domain-containing protein [Haloarculaceae archaeon H-GB11]
MPLEMAVSGLERAREAREQFDAEKVFTVLGNEQCRTVLKVLQDNPRTAAELATEADVPLSTLYRHLNRMLDAALIEESVRLSPNGKHPSEYSSRISDVCLAVGDDEVGLF